jgi:hypothetical protein
MCYTLFGAYPNHMHIAIIVKKKLVKKRKKKEKRKQKKNTTAQTWTIVRARLFNAGLLAKVSLHLEGLATGQLDQGFPWLSLVPGQMLSLYPNSTFHCVLGMQPSQW